MENLEPIYLDHFDFSTAQKIPVEERLFRCVEQIKRWHQEEAILADFEPPLVPPVGADDQEIDQLEAKLKLKLPQDYRMLLRNWRYICLKPGEAGIWGLDYKGIVISGLPFMMQDLAISGSYLVIGDYWRFADGDQLMIKLDHPDQPVILYLHEAGPSMEYYAPSVSLALWRMTYELI